MMDIIFYAYLIFFFGVLPLSACLLFEKYKLYFRWGRWGISILLYSFLSWSMTNGIVYLKYLLDPTGFRGPEGVFALFFGWIYLWITSIPVFLVYAAVRLIRSGKRLIQKL